jgi:hypothetical protein
MPEPILNPDHPVFEEPPLHLMGYVDDPSRHAVTATLDYPSFAAAAPDLMGVDVEADVFLYKAYKEVLGKYPSYDAQTTGDCTSEGSGHTCNLLQCIDIATGHQPQEYKEICTEAIYGIGREIAGMLGRGAGCYGSAVAKALTDFGAVTRELVGPYSGRRADQWGGRGGVPQEIKDACAEHKLGSATLVTTLDEGDAALANGYPWIVCSNQGFTMTRDADGFCQARGSWAHCMHVMAKRTRNGAKQYLIGQSWGDNVPSGPTTDDQPTWSFWAAANVVASMLRGRDSLAFSRFKGFPGKPLPSSWRWADFGG